MQEEIDYWDPKEYDPKSYWIPAGKHHTTLRWPSRQPQEQKLVEFLKTIEFKSVLDLGCAFGRIGMIIMENFEINRYVGVDVSPFAIEKFTNHLNKREIKPIGSPNITLVTGLFPQEMGFAEQFDLVISCEVLMHVKPEELQNTIDHIVSYSKKHIINLDYWEPELSVPRLANHNFLHNYRAYYSTLNVSVATVPFPDKQCLFWAYKNE